MHTENTAVRAKAYPPEASLMMLSGGAFISQALFVAAKLGVADLLKDGPLAVGTLAWQTEADERSLYRVLRTLAGFGVFHEADGRTFSNTPVSQALRSDVPNSARDMIIWMNEEEHWRVYGAMLYSVRTGRPAWDHVHGEPVFPYLFETNRELGETFNRAMISFSRQSIPAILSSCDLSGASVIADIGGGYGQLLGAFLAQYPEASGVLFELPQVIPGAKELLASLSTENRVEFVEGDIFDTIPVPADVYLLKHIIHDWDDEKCRTILRNISRSMPENARVLIFDAVVSPPNVPGPDKILDLEMLMTPGGIERTEEEFAALIESSGLRLAGIQRTDSPVSVIEAVKAS